MKRLKRGHKPVLVDAGGHPRDATGHRTDIAPVYSHKGQRLWQEEELIYSIGERIRAVKPDSPSRTLSRMSQGETGTIIFAPPCIRREYLVLPDSKLAKYLETRSGEFLTRMPEHYLEPE